MSKLREQAIAELCAYLGNDTSTTTEAADKLITLITKANKTVPRIELDRKVVAEIAAIVNGKVVWLYYDDRTFADTEDAENDIKLAEERARRETIEECVRAVEKVPAIPVQFFVESTGSVHAIPLTSAIEAIRALSEVKE